MAKKKARVWISKWESVWGRDWYEVGPLAARPKKIRNNGTRYVQCGNDGALLSQVFCANHFERLFPHLKLKTGEPPRRVEITMEFCD